MSNTISFIIRAIDATKAGINAAKSSLSQLAKGVGSGPLGALTKGLIGVALVKFFRDGIEAARRLNDEAEKTGRILTDTDRAAIIAARSATLLGEAYDKAAVKAVGAWTKFFVWLRENAKTGGLGSDNVRDVLNAPTSYDFAKEEQRLARIKQIEADITAEQEKRMTAEELNQRRKQEYIVADAASTKDSGNAEKRLAAEKALNAWRDQEKRLADEQEKAEKRISALREKQTDALKEAAAAQRELAAAAAEEEKTAKARMVTRALDVAEARTQGAGMAIFAGGRRITAAQSAAMGARVAALRGDDPQKQQRETNIILRDIWRFLGGGK